MDVSVKKIVKVVVGIIATVFLGALGSGLWERIVSHILDSLYESSIRFVTNIYASYLDSIYRQAAKDLPDVYVMKITILILFLVSIFIIIYSTSSMKNESIAKSIVRPFKGKIGFFHGLFLLSLCVFSMSRIDYIQKIKSYSTRSMEILRPHIGDPKYYELRSQFLQIQGKSDFKQYNIRLKSLVEGSGSRLPDFDEL